LPKEITQSEAYDKCAAEGIFIFLLESDADRVASMVEIAEEQLKAAKSLSGEKLWNSTYKLYYDTLHSLAEAFLLLDKVKSRNHLCLFAYLCEKYPSLELDWNFFEKIRTKRNGITYYGTPVNDKDWKEAAVQFQLYTDLLKKEIKQKLDRWRSSPD